VNQRAAKPELTRARVVAILRAQHVAHRAFAGVRDDATVARVRRIASRLLGADGVAPAVMRRRRGRGRAAMS